MAGQKAATSSPADHGPETKLETHDVAFPTRSHLGRDGCFRILLLAAAQINTPQANERIERLPLLDGQGKTAVIFLVAGQDDMEAFMALQMQYVLPLPGP